ncbi:MAG TPA: family 43 glycosylhydrolase [Bacteroidota bacterium]|nr:family 43 glycosylhydrolase [Bacteroidota bacterium]
MSVSAQPTFRNPILTGMNPDPSICRVGDDYYLITSTFEYFPGIPIYQSKDLVNWKMIGYALSRASNNPLKGCEAGTGGQYAPTLRYHDSTFYVICTNYGGQGSQGVFYVTAKNPAGPWSDPHWVNNWYVDPSLLFENDSTYYLSPDNNGSFLLGTLNPETGRFITPVQKIAAGLGGASPEGPHLYKINGYYYLMSAEGGTGYDHREVIQRSTSPWGPYVASPINPVVSHRTAPANPFQAIGHADFVQLPDSSWWLVCLGFRPRGGNYHHLGRETFLAPVSWTVDGWPKVGTDGIVQEQVPVPNLPQHVWEKDPIRDDFDSTSLRLAWNFVRNPYAADWSLTKQPGSLRLYGSRYSFKQKDSPAFVCRRQTAFDIVASTSIAFTPVLSTEEAGLVVRGDDKNHYDLLVTMFAGKRVVMLRKTLRDKVVELKYKEIPDGAIILRISATDIQYQFWAQQEGKAAELIGAASTKDLSTEVIGGFTGTYIGMYASGNGNRNTNPADFDWFDFEEDPLVPYTWAAGPSEMRNTMETPTIVSATPISHNQTRIVWKNIAHETGYLIERYTASKFDSVGSTIADDTVFTDTGLSGNTLYLYRITGRNNDGLSYSSITASVLTLLTPGPYGGTAAKIPGKIEAENYDIGSNSASYFDTDGGNNGGQYRTDDADVETCTDAGGGYNVGWIADGEWMTYTVDVNAEISRLDVRVASASEGGRLHLTCDGTDLGTVTIPNTAGWQQWKTLSLPTSVLHPGAGKTLRWEAVKGGFNLNWISFQQATGVEKKKDIPTQIALDNNYPNPFNPETTLGYELPSRAYVTLTIFDPLGRMVATLVDGEQPSGRHHVRWDASKYPGGMYFYCLHAGSYSETKKLILLR